MLKIIGIVFGIANILFWIFLSYIKKDEKTFNVSKKLGSAFNFVALLLIICPTIADFIKNVLDVVDKSPAGIITLLLKTFIASPVENKVYIIIALIFALLFIFYIPLLNLISKKFVYKWFIKKYFSSYKDNDLLNESKINNCCYSNINDLNTNEKIKKFYQMFIDKKVMLRTINYDVVTLTSNVFSEVRVKNNDIILHIINNTQQTYLLLGDPGSGKSTLLVKKFLDIYTNNKNYDKKIFPFFIDLPTLNNEGLTLKEYVLDKINEIVKKTLYGTLNKEISKEIVYKIYENILKNYEVIYMIDSWDEIKDDNKRKSIVANEVNELLNDKSKVIIGLRENSLDKLLELYVNSNPNIGVSKFYKYAFKVRDFSNYEVNMFLNNLINFNVIKSSDDKEKILQSIKLLTIKNYSNPFIVSLIINNYIKDNIIETKIYKLLFGAIRRICKNDFDHEALQYVGLKGSIGNTTFYNQVKEGLDKKFDKTNVTEVINRIKRQSYLVDKNDVFYQRIFNDFYSAYYIYNNFNCKDKDGKDDKTYKVIINYYFNNPKEYQPIFEYLVIISDNKLKETNNTILFDILKLMLKTIKHENILFVIQVMLKTLQRYSSTLIVKDEKPISLNALENSDLLISLIYRFCINEMIKENIDFDYSIFYYLVSVVNKHHLLLPLIKSIKTTSLNKFKMLSIIRDSYELLHYDGFTRLSNKDSLNPYIDDQIIKLATNNKKVNEMNERELLNYSFYNNMLIDNSLIFKDIIIKANAFPHFLNINNYLVTKKYSNEKISFLSFDCSKVKKLTSTFAIKFVDIDNVIKEDTSSLLKPITLCIYSSTSSSLDEFDIPYNVRCIDVANSIVVLKPYAFKYQRRLVSVILPDNLKSIGDFAFYECSSLNKLYIPISTTYLGESFVEDCFSLVDINLPNNLASLNNKLALQQFAFENCCMLSKIDFKDLKNYYNELNVGLFINNDISNIDSLNISTNIINIPRFCFSKCKNLNVVDLSMFNNLSLIDCYAFNRSINIEVIILPKSLKHISLLSFGNLNKLKSIYFKNSDFTISANAFYNLKCENLVVVINDEAYNTTICNNEQLLEFLKDKGIKIIEDEYIDDVAYLKNDDNTYTIDSFFNKKATYYNTNNIKNKNGEALIIKNTSIGAIGNLDAIDEIVFDSNIIEVSEWLFEDDTSLYLADFSLTKIRELSSHIFENCNSLSIVKLPATLNAIKSYAFNECNNLYKVIFDDVNCDDNTLIIPKNIKEIGEYAFNNNNCISSIIINSSDCIIKSRAFINMKGLKCVTFCKDYNINNIEDNAFTSDVIFKGITLSIEDVKRISNK